MALSLEEKTRIINEYKINDTDVGSSQVQIALLTFDINQLQEHFANNPKDLHSRRGLIRKVNLRRKLLKYLKSRDENEYRTLIKKLGLRR